MTVVLNNGLDVQLNALDLFSGIGGLTFALRDIIRPLAYCDIHPKSRDVLNNLMKKKILNSGPICPDIRLMDKKWLLRNCKEKRVDIILSGSPCIGFSNMGFREGFENIESKLFFEVLRLVDETGCKFVFFENVPQIVRLGLQSIIEEMCIKRNYELRWCIVNARDVGAEHKRSRWFCIAIKLDKTILHFQRDINNISTLNRNAGVIYKQFEWKKRYEPDRMKENRENEDASRLFLLGNSVVPDAVRFAFFYLLNCFDKPPNNLKIQSLNFLHPKTFDLQKLDLKGNNFPSNGVFSKLQLYRATPPRKINNLKSYKYKDGEKMKERCFMLKHDGYVHQGKKSPFLKRKIVNQDIALNSWSTPRASNIYPSNFLTERTIRDLPTQIRFERDTENKTRKYINPNFIEFLMGFPQNYTEM